MSNEDKNQEGEKGKRIEALEKMFGPKETKKPSDDNKSSMSDLFMSEALKSETPAEPKAEPEKPAEPVIRKEPPPVVNEGPEPKKDTKAGTTKNFPLEKIKENLKPELRETLKKIANTVPKESINKLINTMESNKDIVFDKGVTNVFANLDAVEAGILGKKMDEWNVPQEASEVNASVIMAWLNKTKK